MTTRNNEARAAAFEKARKEKGLFGAFEHPCVFDHKRMWLDGFDAGASSCPWVRITDADSLPNKNGSYLFRHIGNDGMYDVVYWFEDSIKRERFFLEYYDAYQLITPPEPHNGE
jgi:hypothetical protein